MKQETSIHLYCVLSSCFTHPIQFVARARGQKIIRPVRLTFGSRPIMGQKKGREEQSAGK
jgi:hypothetical protein